LDGRLLLGDRVGVDLGVGVGRERLGEVGRVVERVATPTMPVSRA
jgi:hypothetical protein